MRGILQKVIDLLYGMFFILEPTTDLAVQKGL